MSKLLYRVESRTNRDYTTEDKIFYEGFYSCCDSEGSTLCGWFKQRLSEEGRHPAPCRDSALSVHLDTITDSGGYYKEYFYGFNSIEQLRCWFYDTDTLSKMKPYIIIRVYECEPDRFYEGNTQTVVHHEDALRVKEIIEVDEVQEYTYES